MTQPERLYLLDGMALVYRAYFAFIARPLVNRSGMNTSAIFGFVTTLLKILDEDRPEHIAVAFDTSEPTFRHTRYPAYKATRERMPEDMAAQLDTLKDVIRAFRVPLIEKPGFEADDIMGTLARQAEAAGISTYLVTGDKDFMQLISPRIRMLRPGKGGAEMDLVDEMGVLEKFGVSPDRVVDVLALTGDSSDNVPGVPGIGEKTAIPLIQRFGSLAGLYDHLADVPQKGVRAKLETHREQAFLSRELVTIDTAVPLEVDVHALRAAERDRDRLLELFTELEFRSLAAKMREGGAPAPPRPAEPVTESAPTAVTPAADIRTSPHTYTCITTEQGLAGLVAALRGAPLLVVDTETTSTDPLRAELVGLSFCVRAGEAFYLPVRGEDVPVVPPGGLFSDGETDNRAAALPRATVLERLRPVLEDAALPKAGQNIKYDMLVLRSHGVEVRGVAFDTMVASYVLRADGQHNLDALALEYFNYRMVSFDDLVGTGKTRKSITAVDLPALADYAAEDADWTFRICEEQRGRLRSGGLLDLCARIEFPLLPVLAEMEFAGIALDTAHLAAMSGELDARITGLITDIHADAGITFNINSTQQLADVLFRKLGLPPVRKTKTGFSTDVGVLESLRGAHPVIDRLLEYRQLVKLKSTYVDALPQLLHPRTGRVHTSFNQTVAATGRLSSSDPNLQNIPIRTDVGKAIRRAFVPGDADHVLLSADYSQIELRIMAHVCGDEALVEAFRNGEDIHATTAARVFGVAAADVSRDMRRKAKEVNFGIMYGIGPFGLANRLEISQTEAKEIITRYFARFPKVEQYITDTKDAARRDGYVSTLLGRRRYLPDITSRNQAVRGNAERQAINMPIQGTAADMIKLAMIRIAGELGRRGLTSRMLLQVHDELVFEVPRAEVEEMTAMVPEEMKQALVLSVPLEVEVGTGANWLDAH
jgi:DNA polymerase-1